MPETQFLFFTKWQEQKRREFNIDPYMLIQETGNRNSENQKTGIQKQEMDCCKITDFAATHSSYFFFFRLVSREIPIAAKLAAPSSTHRPV